MQEYTIRSSHASTIAIDQHARSVAMCALDISTGETRSTKLAGCPTAGDIVGWAAAWATPPMRFVYESGPCGFQLARDIRALGHDCDMIAVSSIARIADDKRFKDDRRDAASLLGAVTAPGSKCRAVWVPSEVAEAARDLVGAYFDMVAATKRLKLQFSAVRGVGEARADAMHAGIPGACARRVTPTGEIPMPNHAKCEPAKPVSANLKLPHARRLQRRPLRLRPAVVWMQPTPERSDGIISGAGDYCLLTGCGTYEAPKLPRMNENLPDLSGVEARKVREFSILLRRKPTGRCRLWGRPSSWPPRPRRPASA